MVSALSKDEGSARGRARTLDSVLSGALGKSLRAMAGEHSGLVHQPASLVGASNTGVVSAAEVRGQRSEGRDLRRHRAARRPGELDARSGHARYLVFVVVVGV